MRCAFQYSVLQIACTAVLQKLVQACLLSELNLGIATAHAAYVGAFSNEHSFSFVLGTGKGQGIPMQNPSSRDVNDSRLAVMHQL